MAIKETIIIEVEDTGLEQTTKKVNDLNAATKSVSDTTNKMASEMKGSASSVLDNGGAMGLLNDATSGYAMMVKDAVEASVLFTKSQKLAAIQQKLYTFAVGTSTGAMKAFRIALISTGIGAIVVALGLLIANFDKVKKVVLNLIPGLGAVADVIGGIIQSVTDFIGVTSDASRALDKMVADSEASLKRNEIFLEANGDKYDEYTQRKIKANIDYNKKVKELAEDEQFTEEEKIKILQQFREKANREIIKADSDREDAINKKRKEIADKQAEEQKKRNEEAKKRLEEQKKKELEEIERQNKIREEANALEAKIFEENLERDVQNELAKQEVLKSIREQTNEQILEEERQLALDKLEQANASQEEFLELQLYYDGKAKELADARSAEDEKLAEEQKERDKAVAQNRINVGIQTAQLIAQLAGEGSAIAKGVAVAQATIDTYKGAVSAYSAMSGIPIVGPVLGAVAAGVVVAAGVANVKKILSTKPVEKGSPSGAASGAAAPQAPSFNLVQGTGANQISDALKKQQQPVKAYVVSSDVTTSQSLDRNIVENSKL
jgi:chemotaxis protein histidine kinase CheA